MIENVRRSELIKQGGRAVRTAGLQIFSCVFGFIAARASVLGEYAPFGIAAAAAAPREYILSAGIGAVLGYFIPGAAGDSFRFVLAVFLTATIKWVLCGFIKLAKTSLFSLILALAASILSGLMMTFSLTPVDMAVVFINALLAAGGTYFFHRSAETLLSGKRPGSYNAQELCSVVITLSVVLIALMPISLYGFSPARITGILVILTAARYGRETMGAVAGICVGFAVSLTGSEMLALAAAYAFGGLIAGLFSRVGNIGTAAAFVLANGIYAIRAGAEPGTLFALYEVFFGSVLFMFMPGSLGVRLVDALSPGADIKRSDGLRKSLIMRLRSASAALCDVSQTVEEVSARLRDITAPDFENIFSNIENEVCKNCGMRLYCWETARAETLDSMMVMIKEIRTNARVSTEAIPEKFTERCPHPVAVSESLYRNFTDHTAKESAIRRIEEVRCVVSDQFEGISDMLFDMSEEFESARRFDADCAGIVEEELRALGLTVSDVSCTIDKYERMSVEISVSAPPRDRINRAVLLERINRATGRDFDVPCLNDGGERTIITLCEKANYITDFGCVQFACSDARMCGDAYQFFADGKGRSIMLLSDGMGSGGRAAVDGAMASGLMSRLIKAGFSFDCALKIVNSAMLFKSADESLATIDISCIDLFTGQTELLKAGAPATIIRRNGKTGRAECSSLPAGILRDIGFDVASITLSAGDIIVMMSDGATTEGTDWICAEIEAWRSGDAQSLAQHLASSARRRRTDRHEDDVTVMTVILEKAV